MPQTIRIDLFSFLEAQEFLLSLALSPYPHAEHAFCLMW
jgi:hypothetical protein